MFDVITVIGNAAIVFTIGQFLSGIQICAKIYKKQNTIDISAFPFIAGVLCNSLWLCYGMIIIDQSVIFTNIIGVTLQIAYLLWYYTYTIIKKTINRQILILWAFFIIILFLSKSLNDPRQLIGLLACVSSLVFCGSPLTMAADAIRTKNTENLPFLLILSSFFVSILWFLYGFMLKDAFLQVPNGIGSIISGLQLCLFVLYPNSQPVQSKLNKDDSMNEPFIITEIGHSI